MKKSERGYKRVDKRSSYSSRNKNSLRNRNLWIITGALIAFVLCGGYFMAEKNHIVAEEITSEVDEFDVTPIVLDSLENQEDEQEC